VRLPNTARAIRRGEALVIVAIGSSSTQGVGASDQAHTYPALLAEELQRRWPRLAVTVVNKGVGGERADGRRQLVQRWLESQSQIIGYHVGLLVDAWYPA
jgi:acyl-CoA thioesterase-1